MNVKIKISDTLAKQARDEAAGAGLSLSAWVDVLIRERLSDKGGNMSLLEALGSDDLGDVKCEFPRDQSPLREF